MLPTGVSRRFGQRTGKRRWETDTVRQLVHAPAVYDGRVFAVRDVDGSPSLAAFSVADGSDRWQSELTAIPESAAPVATQNGVVVSDDRTLVVHDRETGDQRRELGSFGEDDAVVPHTVAVDGGIVFVTTRTALSQSTVKPERYDGTARLRYTN
ncbi:outer membrane protein assembly factor BamB family protein [Halorubrum aethiopicum]|uniref:outer membrane protein assembly factor BamB family protein n=1 Tax=Halorubrum aethiopicum TaxID=1758255 RepID=UPI0018E3DD63|nr:PQQ-binding-like beta-propeller repeat protein [Halorubrum aethiopicum]